MRFRQVEAFRATMVAGTITGAAELLYITQPSASRLIADLEINLGFKLFIRKGGKLQPTPEALGFYREVEKTFIGLNQLENTAALIRDKMTGQVLVTSTPALSGHLLPQLIKRFLAERPNVVVDVQVLSPSAIVGDLRSQNTDIALTFSTQSFSGVEQESMVKAHFICAIPENHPLANKDVIEIQDLHQQDFISLAPSAPLHWNDVHKTLSELNIIPKSTVFTQHANTAYGLVASGLGICIVEPFSSVPWINSGVVIKPLLPSIEVNYCFCFPSNKIKSQLTLEFVKIAREYLASNPPFGQ